MDAYIIMIKKNIRIQIEISGVLQNYYHTHFLCQTTKFHTTFKIKYILYIVHEESNKPQIRVVEKQSTKDTNPHKRREHEI